MKIQKKNTKRIAILEITLLVLATFAFSYFVHESDRNPLIENSEQESVFLSSFFFLRGLFFSEQTIVSAAENEAISTCLKSKDGKICQEYAASTCDSQCIEACIPTQRSDVDACRLGTCYDPVEGTCQSGSPKITCEKFSGTWLNDPFGNQPECNKGCCLMGDAAFFGTSQQCNRQSALLGKEKIFNPDVRNELSCLSLATGQKEGACVVAQDTQRTCTFGAETECHQKNGDFYAGYLCSNPDLNTTCTKQATTSCVDGKDEVYWFDSCGNRENIYDADKAKGWNTGRTLFKSLSCKINSDTNLVANQKTCGNCNNLLGSRCGLKNANESLADTTQNVVCQDLSCVDSDGKRREQGESWCDYQSSIGTANDQKGNPLRATDVAGSRHFKKVCIDGEVRTEPCADYRGEICVAVQNNISTTKSFSTAACRANRWQECMLYNKDVKPKGEGAKASEKVRDDKCTANPDCFIKKINVDDGFKFNICVPRYPPGFDLQNLPEAAEGVCSFADQKCTVIYIKDITGWKCIANCDCETAKFTTQMNDFCMSLGDCGAKANILGEVTKNYKVKKAPKLGKKYLADLVTYAIPVPGKTADPGNVSEFLGKLGIPNNLGQANVPSGGLPGASAVQLLGGISGGVGAALPFLAQAGFLPYFTQAPSMDNIVGVISTLPKSDVGAIVHSLTPAQQLGAVQAVFDFRGSPLPDDKVADLFKFATTNPPPAPGASDLAKLMYLNKAEDAVPLPPVREFLTQDQIVKYTSGVEASGGFTSIKGEVLKEGLYTLSDVNQGNLKPNELGAAFQGTGLDPIKDGPQLLEKAGQNGLSAPSQQAIEQAATPSLNSAGSALATAMTAFGIASSVYGLANAIFGKGPRLTANIIQSGIGLIMSILPLLGVSLGPFGAIGGILITLIFKLLGIGETKKVIVKFTCQAWQPPVGGAKCLQCGAKGFPCSRYACNSLGQRCEFINEGTDNELCIEVVPNETAAPIITPWEGALNGTFSYTDISGNGYTVLSSENDGCVKAYEEISFGISTNEVAQCNLDVEHTESFEDMEFTFGEHSLYTYNHSVSFALPSLESLGIEGYDPNRKADYTLYARCQDKNGNVNANEYVIKLCIRPGDDITPPVVKANEPDIDYVSFNSTAQEMAILVNEPAECKWDITDKNYSDMINTWTCANDVADQEDEGWRCETILPVSTAENNYYTRCKDQPWFAGVNETKRNTDERSYTFSLTRTATPLTINSIIPNNQTLKFGTIVASVEVVVQTSGGLDGSALCGYSFGGQAFTNFIETGSSRHKQFFQSFTSGDKLILVSCEDGAGNIAEKTALFRIEQDITAPEVTRVFGSGGNLVVITNEPAECSYKTNVPADGSDPCGFNIVNGTKMSGEDLYHSGSFTQGVSHYIKCKDKFGNTASGCGIVVKNI